jgi:hypothetical protein
MKTPLRRAARRFEDGSVAIEAAVSISFILLPLLALCFFFGRYFWYYTVAQKAVHDAALYMSRAPLIEIKAAGSPAAALASSIIVAETADLGAIAAVTPTTICEYQSSPTATPSWFTCSGQYAPRRVKTGVALSVTDPFFLPVTWFITKGEDLPILVEATIPYAGR